MLLTLTTTHRPATDLGYLLHKHPDRVQEFRVPFGTAHVLYPEATEERCTAALVLDVDPVGLVRGGRGEGWLGDHPERELIVRRYLKHEPRLYHPALAQLDDPAPQLDGAREEQLEERVSLRDQRLGTVQSVLKASGARRVLDLGCGPGALLERLLRDGYEEIVGVDVSVRALEQAARRLKLDRLPDAQRLRITLLHGPLTYRDTRLAGYDAAALVEVIEHLDPPRLAAAEQNVFDSAQPRTVAVTTPNAEYNVRWDTLPAGHLRHPDHRFEWTRAEFAEWTHAVAGRHGYTARFLPVGPEDPEVGPPTQMAVFER